MAEKGPNSKPKDPRKRTKVGVYFRADELADIQRQVPRGDWSAYCRNAILFPLRSPDPVIQVGARLLAMVASIKSVEALTETVKERLKTDLHRARAAADEADDFLLGIFAQQTFDEISDLLSEASNAARALLVATQDLRQALAHHQDQVVDIPYVEKRPDR